MSGDTIESRLSTALSAVAETQTPTGDWDDVLRRATDDSEPRSSRRWPLLAAAAVAAVAVVSYAVLESEAPRRVEVVPSDGTVVTPPTSVSPATTTLPIDPATSLTFGVPYDELPEWGLVIRDPDGSGRVLGPDGSLLATVNAADFVPTMAQSVVAVPNGSDESSVVIRDETGSAPEGCDQPAWLEVPTRIDGPGASYSVCGPNGGEIMRTIDGTTSAFTGTPMFGTSSSPSPGTWRKVAPSPDGNWLVADRWGGCNAPVTFVIPAETGVPTILLDSGSNIGIPMLESTNHGWTPEGKVIVEIPVPTCYPGVDQTPGVFLIDPAGVADVETVTWLPEDGTVPQVSSWSKANG